MSERESQAERWNGSVGQGWVGAQDVMDGMLQPVEDLLLDAIAGTGPRLLDVGCGTGGTTVAAARRLGPTAECTGVDVSEPMVAAARARAERAGLDLRFLCADAQRHGFEPAGFDVVISRFGVMFFDDPVEAFANLRTATRPGGALRFVAWRGPEENPFMTTAEPAAAPLLDVAPRNPDEPGAFGLCRADRVASVLDASGWSDATIEPVDVALHLPAGALERYLTNIGPLAQALAGVDDRTKARVMDRVLPAFDRFLVGDEHRWEAACWRVGASA